MNQKHDNERTKDEEQKPTTANDLPNQEDDWLDPSKACNRDDPECEACQ